MRLNRFIKEEQIDLHFEPLVEVRDEWDSQVEEVAEVPDGELTRNQHLANKEKILRALVALLEKSERITNPKKCATDLYHRELKASTGLGNGLAIPHVRTLQAKQFVIAVARAPEPGLWFDAIDEEPVRLFVCMVAPNHDDRFYLKVERTLAKHFMEGGENELKEQLLAADDPGEIIRILGDAIDET